MPIALCPAVSRCGLGGVLVPAVSGGGMGCVRICQAVARPSQPINAPKTAKKGLKKSFPIDALECSAADIVRLEAHFSDFGPQ